MIWPLVPLGALADWGSGGTPSRSVREYFGEGTPWLSIADLNDGIVSSARESLTPLGVKNSSAKPVPAGSLLIAMYGSIGKLGIAGIDLCTSQAIAFAKPYADKVETRYLFHWLLAVRPRILDMGRGGTQMNIGQRDLKDLKIPLPPLREQRRIVAILDQADALRAKRGEAIARGDTLTQSIFREMFGSTGASAFPRSLLGEVAKVSGGKRLPKGSEYSMGVTAHPYIRVTDLKGDGIREDNLSYLTEEVQRKIARYTVQPGDVVISIAGSIGLVASVPETLRGANLTENAARIRSVLPEAWDSVFMESALRSEDLQAQIAGRTGRVTIGKLALFRIEQLSVPLPPIELQLAFRERVLAARLLALSQVRQLEKLNALFASLQDRAFADCA
ncbi:MAG: restriction endonuclease subunit S [Cellulomonas sp.]